MKFLSDEWFSEYEKLNEAVEIPDAFSKLVVNIKATDGSEFEGCFDKGILKKGFQEEAISMISASEQNIFTAIILGDPAATLPEVFKGRIKVTGNRNTLLPLAIVKPTPSQITLGEHLKRITTV